MESDDVIEDDEHVSLYHFLKKTFLKEHDFFMTLPPTFSVDCSICLNSSTKEGGMWVGLPCPNTSFDPNPIIASQKTICHAFHRDCIDKWISDKLSCPQCRYEHTNRYTLLDVSDTLKEKLKAASTYDDLRVAFF